MTRGSSSGRRVAFARTRRLQWSSPIALAIVFSLLLAAAPLPAQLAASAESVQAAPRPALPESFAGYSVSSGADPFFLIKKTIVMSEIPLELPVPDYGQVDVLGSFKNAPGSVACGGTVYRRRR